MNKTRNHYTIVFSIVIVQLAQLFICNSNFSNQLFKNKNKYNFLFYSCENIAWTKFLWKLIILMFYSLWTHWYRSIHTYTCSMLLSRIDVIFSSTAGIVAGAVVGGVVFAIFVVLMIIIVCRRRRLHPGTVVLGSGNQQQVVTSTATSSYAGGKSDSWCV